ncbi:MAG: prepilin-type N-terminal cleavage/methylation domain-containing protein [Chloroflexota bacterium]
MRFRNNKGFTLIELLIVLAILGILVGIVAMSVGGLVTRARTTGENSEKEIVQTAIDTYNTQDVGVDNDAAIEPRTTPAIVTSTADQSAEYFGKYLKRDTHYRYVWTTGGDVLVVSQPEHP